MKAAVSFLLACLMLVGSFIPQNDLSELSKLPQLLEHYRFHHSAAGGSLSLGQFLIEHYGSGTKEHFACTFSPRHRQDHEGLPLYGHHTCCDHIAFLLLAPIPLRWPQPVAALARTYRPAGRVLYQDELGPALLQPPRA